MNNKTILFVTSNEDEYSIYDSGSDGRNAAFVFLRSELERSGYHVKTSRPLHSYDAHYEIHINNIGSTKLTTNNKRILILWESEVIYPKNSYENVKKSSYDYIFSWHIGDKWKGKTEHFNLPFPKYNINNNSLERNSKAVMVCGNKFANKYYRNELYSKRLEIINWFEANAPERLDLFGAGWDVMVRFNFSGHGLLQKIINRTVKKLPLKKIPYKIYKGYASNKIDVISKYKFNICYENIFTNDGYLTEKIFDSIYAKCFPIYCGGSYIESVIPNNLYINLPFGTAPSTILEIMDSMSEYEYNSYLANAEDYLMSDSFQKFSPEYFAKKISNSILELY
jgi:hypothetical protein